MLQVLRTLRSVPSMCNLKKLSHLMDLAEICLRDSPSWPRRSLDFSPSSPSPNPDPTAARRNPVPPSRAPQPKSSRAPRAAESRGLGDPEGSRSSGGGAAGSGGKQAPVVAKSSASGAAAVAGLAAMITRSKLVEQLRDYQIRSQHK